MKPRNIAIACGVAGVAVGLAAAARTGGRQGGNCAAWVIAVWGFEA